MCGDAVWSIIVAATSTRNRPGEALSWDLREAAVTVGGRIRKTDTSMLSRHETLLDAVEA
jgi:hypothetical protein